MEISNKTLGLLLIAAVVISLGGTFVSLSKLGTLSTTGYAVNQTGDVILTISSSLSILVQAANNDIDFGSCSINSTASEGISIYDSAQVPEFMENDLCSDTADFPEAIVIENDGNVYANVTLQIDQNGSELFRNPNSWLAYRVQNETTRPGCLATPGHPESTVETYTNFSINYSKDNFYYHFGCGNLSFSDSNDRMNLTVRVGLNSSSQSGGTATITFVGSVSGA